MIFNLQIVENNTMMMYNDIQQDSGSRDGRMAISREARMTAEQVVDYYNICQSIAETARNFGISDQKAKRILIGAGVYTTPLSKKVLKLHNKGVNPEEIGERLKLSRSAVFANLPYSKGQYNADIPSENAIRIRKCRNRQKNKGQS